MRNLFKRTTALVLALFLAVTGIAGRYIVKPAEAEFGVIIVSSSKVLHKVDDNRPVTAKEAARKIMVISYGELDDFIKKFSKNGCPVARVNFILDNDTQVVFSSLCGSQKVWRVVRFDFKDGTSRIIVLDGPLTKEPGILNQEAMNQAINVLTHELAKSSLVVTASKWSERFNLGTKAGLDEFSKFIYNSFQAPK